jgi:hypothetical protein
MGPLLAREKLAVANELPQEDGMAQDSLCQ